MKYEYDVISFTFYSPFFLVCSVFSLASFYAAKITILSLWTFSSNQTQRSGRF